LFNRKFIFSYSSLNQENQLFSEIFIMKGLRFISLLFLFLISCGRKTLVGEGEMGGTSSLTSGILKIKISSALIELDPEAYVVQGEQSFGGTSQDDGNHEFNLSIDEGTLYFSKLKFEIEKIGDNSDCEVITFRPYSYKKSVSPKFKPTELASEINCSGFEPVPEPLPDPPPPAKPIPVPKECYGGPAKDIVDTFPLFTSVFTTNNKLQTEGEFTIEEDNDDDKKVGNRYYVNNLDVLNRGTDQAGLYVAGTMRDYFASCQDEFGNMLVGVQININDFDGSAPNPDVDEYCTWSSEDCGL
jgi:hypothetical protein